MLIELAFLVSTLWFAYAGVMTFVLLCRLQTRRMRLVLGVTSLASFIACYCTVSLMLLLDALTP